MPSRVIPPQQIDLDLVYYIHLSEGPNTINFTPKLDGSNYLVWNKSMKRALGANNKIKFVDGSIQIPVVDDLNFAQWERCNHLIHSWIINSASDQIASTIVFQKKNALDVWDDLHEFFPKLTMLEFLHFVLLLTN